MHFYLIAMEVLNYVCLRCDVCRRYQRTFESLVLWRGTKNIEGAKETILSLRQMQKKVLFVVR